MLLEITFDGMGEGEEEEEEHTEEIAGSATRVVLLKRRDGARRAIVPTIRVRHNAYIFFLPFERVLRNLS